MKDISLDNNFASDNIPSPDINELNDESDAVAYEKLINVVRKHFEQKGYRVHSGLQFGCELVLYADDPGNVHSDFCVHVVQPDHPLDWRRMQTLVRSMPDLHKTLILAHVKKHLNSSNGETDFVVEELALASEHAPFRHKRVVKQVGAQLKKHHHAK
mmetsp:Transcript_675/g.1073  ORF Transcript_675/g.1073 Transcript_675/m.1073 type:complete len:157 (+) Transcript_675:525-995(+)